MINALSSQSTVHVYTCTCTWIERLHDGFHATPTCTLYIHVQRQVPTLSWLFLRIIHESSDEELGMQAIAQHIAESADNTREMKQD